MKTQPVKPARLLSAIAALCVLAPLATAQSVLLDFETSGQFANNFRLIDGAGGTASQTGNGAANDYVTHTKTGGAWQAVTYLYDTTPGDTTAGTQSTFDHTAGPITVSFDLFAVRHSSEFAIIFADALNLNNSIQARLAINNGTNAPERFLFREDVTDRSTSSHATSIGLGSTFTTGGQGLSVMLSKVGNAHALTLSAGGVTVPYSFGASAVNWEETVVLIRLYSHENYEIGIDNFAIAQVPEPASAALAAGLLAVSTGLLRRRRS